MSLLDPIGTAIPFGSSGTNKLFDSSRIPHLACIALSCLCLLLVCHEGAGERGLYVSASRPEPPLTIADFQRQQTFRQRYCNGRDVRQTIVEDDDQPLPRGMGAKAKLGGRSGDACAVSAMVSVVTHYGRFRTFCSYPTQYMHLTKGGSGPVVADRVRMSKG